MNVCSFDVGTQNKGLLLAVISSCEPHRTWIYPQHKPCIFYQPWSLLRISPSSFSSPSLSPIGGMVYSL
jgi:hypothetical protein